VILKEVVLHNFGSYRGRVAIDLSPKSSKGQRPIVLIGALNGSGKTTLLDALLLALYGGRARCSTRGTLAYPDFLRECIHRRTPPSEGASVSVAFEYTSPRMRAELRVTRRWRSTGKGVAEECEVHRDGKHDVELSETWAETVEDLIPLGISNLFFFDGEQVRSIASNAEPTEEVKGAIRTLLGIDLPDQLRDDLEVIAARRRRNLVKEPQTKVAFDQLSVELRAAISRRAEATVEAGNCQNELEAAERELARVRGEFTASGGKIAGRRREVEAALESERRQLDGARERLREVASGALPIVLVGPLLLRAMDLAHGEAAGSDTAALATVLKLRDEEILAAFSKSSVPREAVMTLRGLLKEDRVRRGKSPVRTKLMGANAADLAVAARAVAEARAAGDAARAILRDIDSRERQARRLEAQLNVAAPQESLDLGMSKLDEAQRRVSRAQAACEAARVALADAQHRASQLEASYARISAEVKVDTAVFDEDARVVRAADRVSAVMQEFRQRLLLRRVHELERHIGERFAHLHRKSGAVQRVMIDPTTFRLSLFGDDGQPVNRERMSAGEQQLLAVAFLWGLSLASGRVLPVVIDTPLGRMDHTHRRNLVERYFPRASHQVVLLSTDAEVDETYLETLHRLKAVDREYVLHFDPERRETTIAPGYFWRA
jgi:DNA sulfur modification protein DndD